MGSGTRSGKHLVANELRNCSQWPCPHIVERDASAACKLVANQRTCICIWTCTNGRPRCCGELTCGANLPLGSSSPSSILVPVAVPELNHARRAQNQGLPRQRSISKTIMLNTLLKRGQHWTKPSTARMAIGRLPGGIPSASREEGKLARRATKGIPGTPGSGDRANGSPPWPSNLFRQYRGGALGWHPLPVWLCLSQWPLPQMKPGGA